MIWPSHRVLGSFTGSLAGPIRAPIDIPYAICWPSRYLPAREQSMGPYNYVDQSPSLCIDERREGIVTGRWDLPSNHDVRRERFHTEALILQAAYI